MNYLKIYIKLVKKAKNRRLPEGTYVEKHHVFPASIFGRKGNKNIVKLTYKEHLVAHHLLYSACLKRYGALHYRTIKTGRAFLCMMNFVNKAECPRSIVIAKNIRKANKSAELFKGKNNGMYGKTHSEESKKIMSEKKKGVYDGEKNPMWGKRGENSPHYGKPRSAETKTKISESHKGEKNPMWGKTHADETKRYMSEINKGKKNPFFGKTHNAETRRILSERLTGKMSGENNPGFDPTICKWENVETGEIEHCTMNLLIKNYDLHSGAIAGVRNGRLPHTEGWIYLGEL